MNHQNLKRLGDYIHPVDVRNRDLKVTRLLGVSITKEFMPSIANIVGTDLSTYKVVTKGQFAYGPVTSRNGDKISVALLDEFDDAIISQAYSVFEVIDKNALDPEYLMMWFRRPEFDRYARFKSHGSAREVFDWDEMCEVLVPIPSIEKQREIVAEYNTLQNRIETNKKLIATLEQTAQALYKHTFVDNIDPNNLPAGWRMGTLGEVCSIMMGQSPDGDSYNENGDGMVFYQGRTDFGFRYPLIRVYSKEPKKIAQKDDILLSVRAPVGDLNIAPCECCLGRGLACIKSSNGCNHYLFYLLQSLNSVFSKVNDDGTIFGSIGGDELRSLMITIPPHEVVENFDKTTSIIDKSIELKQREYDSCVQIQTLLLSKMGV